MYRHRVMPENAEYDFTPLRARDLPLVNGWCRAPHVARWWDGETFDENDIADPRRALWLVSRDGVCFGVLQDYRIDAWEVHPLQDLPAGARGLDLFVGDTGMLGKGHGQGMIRARMNAMFAGGTPAVGADPHPANKRSRRMFEACGFKPIGPEVQSTWGPVVPYGAYAEGAKT